jgi:hypothetical protein
VSCSFGALLASVIFSTVAGELKENHDVSPRSALAHATADRTARFALRIRRKLQGCPIATIGLLSLNISDNLESSTSQSFWRIRILADEHREFRLLTRSGLV